MWPPGTPDFLLPWCCPTGFVVLGGSERPLSRCSVCWSRVTGRRPRLSGGTRDVDGGGALPWTSPSHSAGDAPCQRGDLWSGPHLGDLDLVQLISWCLQGLYGGHWPSGPCPATPCRSGGDRGLVLDCLHRWRRWPWERPPRMACVASSQTQPSGSCGLRETSYPSGPQFPP